jgi:acetate kinase
MNVLVLNSGSSSQKSCLYQIGPVLPEDPPASSWEGRIEWHGDQAELSMLGSGGESSRESSSNESHEQSVQRLLQSLWSGKTKSISSPSEIDVVGHRVVHGGLHHFHPTLVTPEVRAAIEGASAYAPLHNLAELQGMSTVRKVLGEVPQVAVFDTGFHQTIPPSAATYPGPYEWVQQGIRRYGFHGINHQYCAQRAARILGRDLKSLKLVTCHLGNGCSLAAIQSGQSVDTTMGFTPLDGLMMGSRSGSVDPGILTYLMRDKKMSGAQLDTLLNQKSGLLGVSGVSGDMREVLAAARSAQHVHKDRAELALAVYVHRLQTGIGAMVAALGGLDALVFTAGVGENSAEVRQMACQRLAFLGIDLDLHKNDHPSLDQDISMPAARVRVLVIRAQEDWMIARECHTLISGT